MDNAEVTEFTYLVATVLYDLTRYAQTNRGDSDRSASYWSGYFGFDERQIPELQRRVTVVLDALRENDLKPDTSHPEQDAAHA